MEQTQALREASIHRTPPVHLSWVRGESMAQACSGAGAGDGHSTAHRANTAVSNTKRHGQKHSERKY